MLCHLIRELLQKGNFKREVQLLRNLIGRILISWCGIGGKLLYNAFIRNVRAYKSFLNIDIRIFKGSGVRL